MKKLVAVFTVIMLLVLVSSAFAIDQKGRIAFGGYGGYAVGFGDYFKSWESDYSSSQNKPNFSFGAKGKYGLTSNVAVVGAVEYQSGKWEWEQDIPGTPIESESDSWNWIGILANIQYVMMQEGTTSPYVTAGGGFYIPSQEGADSKPGVNVGFGVEHFVGENIALDGGARFHMIFFKSENSVVEDEYGGLSASMTEESGSWDNATYVQLFFGVTIFLPMR
jgi:hypothetical protein